MSFLYAAKPGFRPGSAFIFLGFSQAGGDDAFLDDVDEYVQVNNTWTSRNDHPTPLDRAYPCATTIGTDAYVFAGGFDGAYVDLADKFTPPNTWVVQTSVPTPERNGAGCAAMDGKAYLFGGWDGSSELQDNDEFDPNTGLGGTWTTRANLPSPARQKFGCASIGTKAFLMGGETNGGSRYSDLDIYNQADNTWHTGPPADLPGSSRSENVALAIGALVYTFGGENNLKRVDSYDPNTDTYSTTHAAISTGNRWSAAGAMIGGKAYLFAGKKNGSETRETTEYDPVGNVWAVREDCPAPSRIGHCAASI